MTAQQTRPKKLGQEFKRVPISRDSEETVRVINNTSGSPVYVGRAKAGSAVTAEVWQICKHTYDTTGSLQKTEWAQNSSSKASTEYEHIWNTGTTKNITGITKANPGVVTANGHGLSNGDYVTISSVVGMTEVNHDNTTATIYIVAGKDTNTFQLTDVDGNNVNTSGYTTYTSGGTVNIDFDALNKTFS